MANGALFFPFDYILGGIIRLDCEALIRFGKVQSVVAKYDGKVFDPVGLVIDWDDEFIPLAESLKHYAVKFYKESMMQEIGFESDAIVFIPESYIE